MTFYTKLRSKLPLSSLQIRSIFPPAIVDYFISIIFLISENFDHLVEKYQIDYIFLSSQEKAKYGNKIFKLIQKFPVMYQNKNSLILGVSERVQSLSESMLDQDSN